MKIAIATDDKESISEHFGRTLGFLVYEVEDGNIKNESYRKNNFTFHAQGIIDKSHNMDKHSKILSALNDCQVVISNGMGRRIYEDLQSANIKPFIVNETNIKDALDLFLQNQLVNIPDKKCEH